MDNFFFYKELHENYVFHFAEKRRVRLLKNLGPTSIKNCQNTVTVKKSDLFRRVESYFFIDLDQFVRIKDNWFDFKSSYKKFPRFFPNLKCITENEIDNFLVFFGASSMILSDQVFKRKVVFFFSNLRNDYCIFLLFLYHTVYEFYYLVAHKVTSIHFLIKLAELVNQRLLINFRTEDDRTFTVRIVGMTEYIYALMYENVRVKVASYNSLKDQSLWLEFSKDECILKFPDNFLEDVLTFYFSLFRMYLRFFFFLRKKSIFLVQKGSSYSFLCKFFLKKNFSLSLLVLKKMDVFFRRSKFLDNVYTEVQMFFEIFMVLFVRFFRKFFLFFFKNIKKPGFFDVFSKVFLKILQKVVKRFINMIQALGTMTTGPNTNIFVYNYIFRSFSFDHFSNLSRFNFQLQKFPGSDIFASNSLMIFKDLNGVNSKRFRELSFFLVRFFNNVNLSATQKLKIFLLFRFDSIIHSTNAVVIQNFFQFVLKWNCMSNIFTERTRYYYKSFFNNKLFIKSNNVWLQPAKISSYFIESFLKVRVGLFFFFSGLANYFKVPAFYVVLRTMDFPKFEYVPIPLRISSVMYDLFGITSEDNMVEDEDTQLEMYEDYLADIEEEQSDEADEDQDDWYWIYYAEDYEESEPTFFLLDEHLHINLHSNVLLKRKYSDDALPLLASNINPEGLVEHYPTPQRPFRLSYWGFLEDFFKYLYHEQHILKSEYMLFFTDLWLDGIEDLGKFDKYFSYNSTKKFGTEGEENEESEFFWSFDNKFKDFYDLAQKELDDYFTKRVLAYNIETRQWSRFWFNYIQVGRVATQALLEKVVYIVYEFFAWAQYKNLKFNERYTLIPQLGYVSFDAYPEINEPDMFLSHDVLVSTYFERPIEGFRFYNMLSFYDLNNMVLGPNYFANLFDPKYLYREGLNVSSSVIEDYFSDVYSTFVNRYVHSDVEPHVDIDYYEKFFDLSCDDYFNYNEQQLDAHAYTNYYTTLEPGDDNNDIDDFEDMESAMFGEGSFVDQRGIDLEKDDPSFSLSTQNSHMNINFNFEPGEIFGINAVNYKHFKDQGFISLLQLKNFFVAEGLTDYQHRLESLYFDKDYDSIPLRIRNKKSTKKVGTVGIFSPTLKLFKDLGVRVKPELNSDFKNDKNKLRQGSFGFQIGDNSAILHNFVMCPEITENINGFFFLNSLDQTIHDQKYRIFYKFVTIFLCRREDLNFLKSREPEVVFLLRFLLFSVVTHVYRFFKKVDLFNFFLYLFPAFFFFTFMSIFKKLYKLNSNLDVNSLINYYSFSDVKFDGFYSSFCSLNKDPKKMKEFFTKVLFQTKTFVKKYLISFSSYENRSLFLKKYSRVINFLFGKLTNMCCVVFFRKSDFFFTHTRMDIYTKVKDLESRGDFFSKVYGLSLSPSLRSYVSTLLDYYGDEKTFFSKLSDKDFLCWLRRGSLNVYEDTSVEHIEVLKSLRLLRKKLETVVEPIRGNYAKDLKNVSVTAFKVSLDVADYNFFEAVLSGKTKYKNKVGSPSMNRSLEIETYLTDFEDLDTDDLDINDDWDEDLEGGEEDRLEPDDSITFDEHELLGDADQKNFEDYEYRTNDLYDDFFYEVDINPFPDSYEDTKTYIDWPDFEQLSQQSVKFRKNKIFYLFYLGEAFWSTVQSVLRDYLIAFYRYYLDHSLRIKDFTVRFDKILDFIENYRKLKNQTSFTEDFNTKYTRNNAILQTYIQRNLLDDLDNYLHPEYDYEEFDFVYSDINQVKNNVSAFDHLLYDHLNQKSHFDYFILNFTFLESKRTKIRLVKLLYNEFNAVPIDNFFVSRKLTPANSIDVRFFWFEAETLMIRRVFGLYYSGFFFKNCNLTTLFYSTRGSFRLLKFVLLRVRIFFLSKLRNKMDFLRKLRLFKTDDQRREYLRNYFFARKLELSESELGLLLNYIPVFEGKNNFFTALDVFDLHRLLKLASFLKRIYRNALTSFGYILLVQELMWLNFTVPNLSQMDFRKKFFEYFNCLKIEESFFYKNYYSLYQIFSKYGINEAQYYLESKIKYQEVELFLVTSVPKSVKIYSFVKDLIVLLIFFAIIIFLCSDYNGFVLFSETYFGSELEYEEEPYEEPFEFRLSLFPDTTRARKREFITEFYEYFMRLW